MEHETTFEIHENALTTDTISKLDAGYTYRGHNRATYRLDYYTYLNEWCDAKHSLYGKTLESVLKRYDKATGRLKDVQDSSEEWETTTEDLAYEIDYMITW